MPYESTPPLRQTPPPLPPGKQYPRERAGQASIHRDDSADTDISRRNLLRFVGLAASFALVLLLVGGFVAVRVAPNWQRQLTKFFWGPENTEEEQSAPTANGEPGSNMVSLGTITRAERNRRREQDARQQQREAEADKQAAETDFANTPAVEARIATERKQKEESEQADRENARQHLTTKQATAYASLANLDGITQEDVPVGGDLGEKPLTPAQICSLDAETFIDLSLDLAVPRDPLLEEGGFVAAIEPVRDHTLSWSLSPTPSRTFETNALSIPLATITVKDGKLTLTPAIKDILAKPLFSHVRRFVLLLKARNPQKLNEPIGVVKAIQLVRPFLTHPFMAPALGRPSLIRLTPPSGTYVSRAEHKPKGLPNSAQVDYEFSYDFALDGKPEQAVYTATWPSAESRSFLPLLQCPSTTKLPADLPTFLGLQATFADGLSRMKVVPTIRGPAENFVNLEQIKQTVSVSDADFEASLQVYQRQASPLINDFDVSVDKAVPNTLNALLQRYDADIAVVFGQKHDDWERECLQILEQAAKVAKPGHHVNGFVTLDEYEQNIAPLRTAWHRSFVAPLKDWAEDRAKRQQERTREMRRYFTCLNTPARVTVQSITIVAYDRDNNEYALTPVQGDSTEGPKEGPPPEAQGPESTLSL